MGDWADDCERQADFDEEEELDYLRRVNEAQAAVIEAAKVLVHEQRHGTLASVAKAEWAQADAVEALLAAEKGE